MTGWLFVSWVSEVLEYLEVQFYEVASAAFAGVVLLNIVHLAYSSVRTAAKRTWWDRRAGTIVRYRR